MPALSIVPDLDVVEDCGPRGDPSFPDRVTEFGLHGTKEALDNSIVPTITLPAHTLSHPACAKSPAKVIACILAAAIGVEERCARWTTISNCGPQGVECEAAVHRRFHRPSDNAARDEVDHDGEIEPSLTCEQIRYVARPNAVFSTNGGDIKRSRENIRSDRQRVIGIGRLPEAARRNARDCSGFHETPHLADANLNAVSNEFRVHASATVRLAALAMNANYFGPQPFVGDRTTARGATTPLMVSGCGYLEVPWQRTRLHRLCQFMPRPTDRRNR